MSEEAKEAEVKQEAPVQEPAPVEQETQEAQVPEEKAASKKDEPERQDLTTLHERTIAAMSYFGFLAIVPFYLKKDSEFCRFHGKQGLFLAIFFFLAKLFTVIDFIFDLTLILQVALLFIMGFAALSGRWKKLPFGYAWACQLEEALTLKTKEQEEEEVGLKPDQISEEADSKK